MKHFPEDYGIDDLMEALDRLASCREQRAVEHSSMLHEDANARVNRN